MNATNRNLPKLKTQLVRGSHHSVRVTYFAVR